MYVVAGLDHRWNWSSVPLAIVIAGNLLFVGSFIVFLFVFRQNSLASAVVEVQSGQRVVKTGLYGIVRHPMYVGAVLFFLATPLALASYWAISVGVLLIGIIVARLIDEERFLLSNLAGYEDYCRQVRYRLLPLVW